MSNEWLTYDLSRQGMKVVSEHYNDGQPISVMDKKDGLIFLGERNLLWKKISKWSFNLLKFKEAGNNNVKKQQ